MEKKIIWQKWIDPFGSNLDEFEFTGYDTDPFANDEKGFDDTMDLSEELSSKPKNPIPIMVIPMLGAIPLSEHNAPSKVFNFWMMHTNFNLGEIEGDIIDNWPGIESLEIITRYRCRISVGHVFDHRQVRLTLQNKLCSPMKSDHLEDNMMFDQDVMDEIQLMKIRVDAHYKHWAILITPNGEMDCIATDEVSDEDFSSKLEVYKSTKELAGGAIITSWDE